MARVTIEDCIKQIPDQNHFDLVMLSAQRARQISSGTIPTIDRDNDKNPVIALREIARGNISAQQLLDSVVQGYRKHLEPDQTEQEMADMLLEEHALYALEQSVEENFSEAGFAITDPESSNGGEVGSFSDNSVEE